MELKMSDKQIENFIFTLFAIYSNQIGRKIVLKKRSEDKKSNR